MYDPNTMGGNDMGGPLDSPYQEAPPSPMDSAKDFLQKNGKMIVLILVVGTIGFFVYDFFVGSLVNTTLELRDTEGRLLSEVSGKVYEGSSSGAIKTFQGTTTLALRPGNYRVEWDLSDTDYEDQGAVPFTVDPANKEAGQEEQTVVEKPIPVNLTNLAFPSALVAGQTHATATLTLENKSTQVQEVELVFEGDFDPKILTITTQPSTISLNPNASLIVALSINVPSNVSVKNTKNGDTKNGKVRIKYTTSGKSAGFTLFKSLSLDVNPKTPQVLKATANQLTSKTFTIRNAASVDSPETVKAEVTVNSAQNNDAAEAQKWFGFNPTPPLPAPKKGESIPIVLQVNAPAIALSDTITGEIKFFTGFWSQVIPFTLTLTEAPVELKVTLDGTNTLKKYTISKDATGLWEAKNAVLKLENGGGLAIENILLDVGDCGEYIKPLDPDFFANLTLAEKGKAQSSKSTTLQITAPLTQIPGNTQNCLIEVSYLDPKNGDVGQANPISVQIDTQ